MSAPKKIFGTDGVRGTANIEPVTAETALKLGRAAGHVFKTLESEARGHGRHKIVLGKDTRLSGYMLENAISSGILSMGVDVLFIGPLPTPGVAYVTRSLRADAGIVITASHNPYADNGIKFFRADGYKLDDRIEAEIEDLVFSGRIENIRPTAEAIGKAVRIDPTAIQITVRGEGKVLEALQSRDIRAEIDLTGIQGRAFRKRVDITLPEGIVKVQVVPADVEVILPQQP